MKKLCIRLQIIIDGSLPNKICKNCEKDIVDIIAKISFIKQKIRDSGVFLRTQIKDEIKFNMIEDDPVLDLNDFPLLSMGISTEICADNSNDEKTSPKKVTRMVKSRTIR